MNRTLTAGIVGLAVVAAACGSGSSVTDTAGAGTKGGKHVPVAVKVGQQIKVDSESLAATYTLSDAQTRATSQYGGQAENGIYLLAHLRIDVAKGETYACACELSLVQADGKVRDSTFASFSGKEDFQPVQLKGGQHQDGWVTWDLPKAALKGAKVQLKVQELGL